MDERESRFKMKRESFGGVNRHARHGVPDLIEALKRNFQRVYPNTEKQARVRRFKWDGQLDLYAWVVERR